jgi:hypothetical protein
MSTWRNKQKKAAYHRARRLAVVDWLKTLRVKCMICGECDPIVLDFHHREPQQKDFQLIGSFCYSRSRESILKEIAKCDVLCSNCHRRVEFQSRHKKEGE